MAHSTLPATAMEVPTAVVTGGVDTHLDVHVVAALSGPALSPLLGEPGTPGLLVGGEGAIQHTVSRDGHTFSPGRMVAAPEGRVQWNPALAITPSGGVAVSFLQTADGTLSSYDARLVTLSPSGVASGPLVLSDGVGPLPPASEAVGNSNCYGIGDYTGLTPTPSGVVAIWPTTFGAAGGAPDSDIAVRSVRLR